MGKFHKRILSSRTYHSPDGELKVTPERVKHWAETFQRFKQAGLSVPVAWGHADNPDDSKPVKRGRGRRKPDRTVGYLHSFDIADDGSADIVLDIREDENKVEKNLAYVSPVIFDKWADGDGQEWKDCITHVDLVQYPVDHRQTEFTPVTACALRMGLDTGSPQIYRLETEMAEETENVEESSASGDRLKKVIAGLAQLDIVISADTTEENFLEHLEQALLTAAAMQNADSQSQEGMEVTSPQVSAMSLNDQTEGETTTTPTPEVRPDNDPRIDQLSLDNDRRQKHLDRQHQTQVKGRLQSLLETGRCTPPEHKEREEAAGAVRLSLSDDGTPIPSALESWIEAREQVPAGTFWPSEQRTRMSAAEVVSHPSEVSGDQVTDEEADEIVAGILGKKK